MTDRISRWRNPFNIMTTITGDNREKARKILNLQKELRGEEPSKSQILDIINIISACKELIYRKTEDKIAFEAIMYVLNSEKLEIQIERTLEITFEEDSIDEEVQKILALATIHEIPVYPNTPEIEHELIQHYKNMLMHGFLASDGRGGQSRFKITKKSSLDLLEHKHSEGAKMFNAYQPAEFGIILQSIRAEIQRRDHAGNILTALSLAIAELEEILNLKNRNEHALQCCLTKNPILFGTEYVRLNPKHRLGSDYEMDYALERTTGLFDLVEIESSSLKLFNKKGDPSSDLVHAEQQVFNWLSWIGKHASYARESLPDLLHPVGFVVIGRRNDLNGDGLQKLKQRNSIFKGQIHILTYDDLLDKAKNISQQLSGLA